MADALFFAVYVFLFFGVLAFRYYHERSLHHLTKLGSVSPSYWGTYGEDPVTDAEKTIQLPNYGQVNCQACHRSAEGGKCHHAFVGNH